MIRRTLFGRAHLCQWRPGRGYEETISTLQKVSIDMEDRQFRSTYLVGIRSNDRIRSAEVSDLGLDHRS